MTCNRCNGAGYIFGHWMPELCPECLGEQPEATPIVVNEPAKACDWIVVGAVIAGVVITIAAWWGVIEFFVAVL